MSFNRNEFQEAEFWPFRARPNGRLPSVPLESKPIGSVSSCFFLSRPAVVQWIAAFFQLLFEKGSDSFEVKQPKKDAIFPHGNALGI